MIWAYFMQLSNHMWDDGGGKERWWYPFTEEPYEENNRVDFEVWDRQVRFAAEKGVNMLVIDVGDGVKYESHPEISAPDAVSKEFLKQKLDDARALGLTPIPKLNFSAEHHCWLKEYRRMVSSQIYRKVCVDLIDELCELFDHPKFFHLGMDEETSYDSAQWREITVMRGEKLMFEDFGLFFEACRKNGARPWTWSDYRWINPEIFERRMPRDVLQSNWFYGRFKDYPATHFYHDSIMSFSILDKLGFDQIPTCSNLSTPANPWEMMMYCPTVISKEHLLGYEMAPWREIRKENEHLLMDALERFAFGREKTYGFDGKN